MFNNGYNGYYGCGCGNQVSPAWDWNGNNRYPQRDNCCQRAFERGFRLGLSYADDINDDDDDNCCYHHNCRF